MQRGIVPDSVCDSINISDADRSGAHGTRKVTITSQFVTIDFYLCINVLEQTMFISKLCDTLKSMPRSVDSDLLLSAGCTHI